MKIPSFERFTLFLAAFATATTAATSLFAADAARQNWPQWRGPNGNGIVSQGNPPLEWSETKNIKWKVPIPGSGHATPIIWNDKIFILTAVPEGGLALPTTPASDILAAQVERPPQERRRDRDDDSRGGRGRRGGFGGRDSAPTEQYAFKVLCLDRVTGAVRWEKEARKEVPHQGIQGSNTYSSGSPVTDGQHLYVSFGSQGLYCYDLEGNLVWSKDLGKVPVQFGEGASPALHGDTLIVVQDNREASFIYAFDKKTGEEIWKKERDESSGWTTPYILTRSGKTQVIVPGSNAVRSYDIENGEVIWQCGGLGSNPVPVVVADDERVYAMSGHREPYAMAIKLGRTGDLTGTDAVVWSTTRGTPYVPSPLLYDGLLFFCQRTSGILTCVDAATGEAHYEQERLEGVSGVYASLVGVNDRIYLAGREGTTIVIAKSPELKVLAQNKLDDGFDASPVVVGNQLFLRGNANLYCIEQVN